MDDIVVKLRSRERVKTLIGNLKQLSDSRLSTHCQIWGNDIHNGCFANDRMTSAWTENKVSLRYIS
jgi:hypothetical protein